MLEKVRSIKTKVLFSVPAVAAASTLMSIVARAEESGTTSAMTSAFTSVAGEMKGMITAGVPVAAGVVGAVMAVKFGFRFFKSIMKG